MALKGRLSPGRLAAERRRRVSREEELKEQGFDKCWTTSDWPPAIKVGCSQCEALVVNGVATHERGCPNARRAKTEVDSEDG